VDYLDKTTEIIETKLVLVVDSLDAPFINMMFRYVDVTLLLQPTSSVGGGIDSMTSKGFNNYTYGGNSFGYTKDDGSNTENTKNIQMVLKHKSSPSGMDEKVLFSSMMFKNERLVCAI
jgi:hypothetical protein